MKHAYAPHLCANCHRGFLAMVEQAPTGEATNGCAWCPHNGTLVVATVHKGEVTRWITHGPLDEGEAMAMVRELEAQASTPVSRSRPLPSLN
jgi:hypothetical protein